MNILKQDRLTELPVLKIKGSVMGNRILGSNVHDTYVLGKDGGLHYLNIQGMIGTEYGELEFEVDNDDYEKTFKSWNFIELMDHDAKRLGIEEEEEYKEARKKIKNIFIKAMKNKDEKENKIMMEVLNQHFEEFEGKKKKKVKKGEVNHEQKTVWSRTNSFIQRSIWVWSRENQKDKKQPPGLCLVPQWRYSSINWFWIFKTNSKRLLYPGFNK